MMTPGKSVVRVRFAPSPTGHPHIGLARTTLFNWLFARQKGGVFVLRIEDTDHTRSKPEYEKEILDTLQWLGLDWDEGPLRGGEEGKGGRKEHGDYGPYRQSERGDHYRKYLERLLEEKKAYWCYCTKEDLEAERETMSAEGLPPKYGGHCRNLTTPPEGQSPQAIRFRVPEMKIEFHDLIRGKVSFDGRLFGDIIIATTLDRALYNFAVVIDDYEMNITHVIRSEDHISNTPKQILFAHALGFPIPEYGHFPLILAPDRSKLSKRSAETSLLAYRDEGYLPEAMINFMALLGWHPSGDRELFTREELIKEFDLRRIQKSGAVFNEEKLRWMNREYLRALPLDELAARLTSFFNSSGIHVERPMLENIIQAMRDRAATLKEFVDLTKFFFTPPPYEKSLLVWKKDNESTALEVIKKLQETFSSFPEERIALESIEHALESLITLYGRGTVLWPLRVALSGQATSPDPLVIAHVLGKSESLKRIEEAAQKLSS